MRMTLPFCTISTTILLPSASKVRQCLGEVDVSEDEEAEDDSSRADSAGRVDPLAWGPSQPNHRLRIGNHASRCDDAL